MGPLRLVEVLGGHVRVVSVRLGQPPHYHPVTLNRVRVVAALTVEPAATLRVRQQLVAIDSARTSRIEHP
jgi:hypothetical protein